MDNNRRNRGQWGRNDDAPRKPEPRRDAGAYIGRMPERSTEIVPGGFGRRDQRAPAVATQPAPARGDTPADAATPPEGHREPGLATDETKGEAGQNR